MINKVNLQCAKYSAPAFKSSKAQNLILQNSGTKLLSELSFLGARNKIQLETLHFKGRAEDEYSVHNFYKARKEAGIETYEDIQSNIKPQNLLGEGANSAVYAFDNPILNKWAIKIDKNPNFETSKDEFQGVNMGQEIQFVPAFRILKRINGEVHSLNNWSAHINNNSKITSEEAEGFSKSLNKISAFSQDAFDDYAVQLKLLGQKGYKQDSINPNNLLIDYEKQKINIIDSFKAVDPSHVNSRLDLINVLLDFSLFGNIYEALDKNSREEFLDSAKTIIDKCTIASKKEGLAQDEETYLKYLANVDKWFGFKLVDKGGDYTSRYEKMKSLLPDIEW